MKHFLFLAIALIMAVAAGCSKGEPVSFSFTSHKNNAWVSRPLPLKVWGKITNWDKLDPEQREELHVYLVEQGDGEQIWHVEPKVSISKKGTWRGLTWLGNRKSGNRKNFTLCVFASPDELKLNNGDHPVTVRPDANGHSCITLRRSDR